ncbi:MAG: hypothetical protein HY963_01845 [Ignavibacteriales bacterium]|nr:hypothetical protein [Ignavibacteriales bacterium]
MKKFSVYLFLIFSFVFLLAACSKSSEEKPANNSNNSSGSTGSVKEKLTANKWNMMMNGQSYGTINFNSDGTCLKTAEGGAMETNGIWKLDGANLTLNFPSEGEPFSGSLSVSGENLIAKFMDGAITYTYTPAK